MLTIPVSDSTYLSSGRLKRLIEIGKSWGNLHVPHVYFWRNLAVYFISPECSIDMGKYGRHRYFRGWYGWHPLEWLNAFASANISTLLVVTQPPRNEQKIYFAPAAFRQQEFSISQLFCCFVNFLSLFALLVFAIEKSKHKRTVARKMKSNFKSWLMFAMVPSFFLFFAVEFLHSKPASYLFDFTAPEHFVFCLFIVVVVGVCWQYSKQINPEVRRANKGLKKNTQ